MMMDLVIPIIVAFALGLAVYWALDLGLSLWNSHRVQTTLRQYMRSRDDQKTLIVDRALPIRLAFQSLGLDVKGWENRAFWFGVLASTVVLGGLAAVFLPPVFVLASPVASYFLVRTWVETKWEGFRQRMEKELPLVLTRLAATLPITPNLLQALDEVLESMEQNSPLRKWMQTLVHRLHREPGRAFRQAIQEAEMLSPTLVLFLRELKRVWETGGVGYVEAFNMVAENLTHILDARAEAMAAAAGAWGTIRVILLALGTGLVVIMSNPQTKALFYQPLNQVLLVLLVVWGVVGYFYIQGLIREVSL